MFNALIIPIITFGGEIWGLSCSKDCLRIINTFAYNFYKEILSIPKSIPNSAVNMELDVMSPENVCVKKALNYYLRTINSNKTLQNLCMKGKSGEQCSMRLSVLGIHDPFEDIYSKQVKTIVKERSLLESLQDINNKTSLSLYSRLYHYKGGAKYLNSATRDVRYLIANFRMYGFKWNSRKINGERICVLCDGIESVEHLIEDCEGTSGELRQALNSMELYSAQSILNIHDVHIIPLVGKYLKFILDKRQSNL